MRKAVSTLIHHFKTLQNINRLELNKNLKNSIKRTYWWAIILKRIDLRKKSVNVAGYKVSFLSNWAFQYLFKEIFIDQEYHFITTNKCPLIIDCGSNIGMSILYFKLIYPSSRIIAFEPDLNSFLCLKKNIEQNNLQDVVVYNKAVSDSEGSIAFYFNSENPGALDMSIIQERMYKKIKEVDAVHLSRYISERVDFLKIDIEGAESDVIQELSNSGKLNYINQMVIEYHHHIVRDQDILSKILSILENGGFGYQISSQLERPLDHKIFQDIFIYAYQKNTTYLGK